MKASGFCYALSFSAAAAMLAACGGSLAADGEPTVVAKQAAWPPPLGIVRTDPRVRGRDLLYASSVYTCDVYVFSYPRGKLFQTLNACDLGFGPAFGLCTDRNGDVFMAMGEGFSVFEYAHGGTEPIAQLQNAGLLPVGCSVDPKTGDLGVASATGNVAIFKNASGNPQIYSLSNISKFFFCTFDDRGNLFVDGEHNNKSFALVELPKGANALREITVPGNVEAGFGLQWDGRHVAIGKTQGLTEFIIKRLRVSGSVAKFVDTTALAATPNTYTPFQFWIQGGTIIQPEQENSVIGLWNYPDGGGQTKGIPIEGSTLVGVTVSIPPNR